MNRDQIHPIAQKCMLHIIEKMILYLSHIIEVFVRRSTDTKLGGPAQDRKKENRRMRGILRI